MFRIVYDPKNGRIYYRTKSNIHTRFTGLAMAGEMSPKDALDGMQAELEALYARTS